MAKSALIGVFVAFLAGAAAAAQEGDMAHLWRFAKANVDKYAGEVGAAGAMTLKTNTRDLGLQSAVSYDPEGRRLVDRASGHLRPFEIARRCRQVGTFEGENAFGVRRTVRRMECEVLAIEEAGVDRLPLGELDCTGVPQRYIGYVSERQEQEEHRKDCELQGSRVLATDFSPQQFRDFKAKGLPLRLSFQPGAGVEQPVVERNLLRIAATIERPVETVIHQWTVRGRILSALIEPRP
ncbi:MAG TPA: hypothetical protein PKV00_15200 [Thauera sp.]|nr:hypothetical protein [Thauera sp.]